MPGKVRSPHVAGRFYPEDESALRDQVSALISRYAGEPKRAFAVVVPHAGYVYSGGIAGETFAQVEVPERAVILGPNHTGRGAARSVYPDGQWLLPGGGLDVDSELVSRLLATAPLQPDTDAHAREHCIEVELPFLRARNPAVRIVPICLRHLPLAECRELGLALGRSLAQESERALLVASTDMSHFLSARDAEALDTRAIAAVQALDAEGLYRVVEDLEISMCGFIPTCVMLFAARELGATKCELVRYGNSGEAGGDYSRVVGYAGFVVS